MKREKIELLGALRTANKAASKAHNNGSAGMIAGIINRITEPRKTKPAPAQSSSKELCELIQQIKMMLIVNSGR